MSTSYTIYSLAIAWFTYTAFRMAVLLYQFMAFPKTYGSMPKLSLRDLVEMADDARLDIPVFKLVIPAYKEVDVIEGTIRNLTKLNYPATHLEVYVTTYEDEPVTENEESTTAIVKRVAKDVNEELDCILVRSIVVPKDFDGYFPGSLSATEQHIGKARGLNYSLRHIHQAIEMDERRFYIGMLYRSKKFDQTESVIQQLIRMEQDVNLSLYLKKHFSDKNKHCIESLSLSTQLEDLVQFANKIHDRRQLDEDSYTLLTEYIREQAPRFFYHAKLTDAGWRLELMHDKEFLRDCMLEVEALARSELEIYAKNRLHELNKTRPYLCKRIKRCDRGEQIYQVARKLNSRWLMVYDADADAPADVMRYLAGRILMDESVMGFQGPVAPVLNYLEVHALCKLGGLWMAFWHAAKYPRLMNNPNWAHPLAGTNWCFRIEGFEQDGRLIRNGDYAEDKRRFLLSFDPKQLTEDLEAGIRFYSNWTINAQWHPVIEMEQVPPTPQALVVQRTRWTLGTLQTIGDIIRSKIPFWQKLRFVFHPAEIIVNGSGPVITVALLVSMVSGVLVVNPIFAWWAVILTFGNLIYVMCFEKVFEYYYEIMQRDRAMEFINQHRDQLVRELELSRDNFSKLDAERLDQYIKILESELNANGFIDRYYESRCVDDDYEQHFKDEALESYYARLLVLTHGKQNRRVMTRFLEQLKDLQSNLTIKNSIAENKLLARSLEVVDEQRRMEGKIPWLRWSRYHTQILFWTFPYIFYQLIPYFKGLLYWVRGDKTRWHKTMRTRKHKPDSNYSNEDKG